MTLDNALDKVTDKKSFLVFVQLLLEDREKVENKKMTIDGFQGDWANNDISSFLEASLAWAEDSDFVNQKNNNPWNECATFLLLGKIYE